MRAIVTDVAHSVVFLFSICWAHALQNGETDLDAFLGGRLGWAQGTTIMWVHVGATRRKGLIDLQGAAVRLFPLLLWPLVLFA